MGIIAILALLGVVGIGYGRSQASKAREEEEYEKQQAAKLAEARAAATAAELARRKAALDERNRQLAVLARMPTTLRSKALTIKTNPAIPAPAGVNIRGDEDMAHL